MHSSEQTITNIVETWFGEDFNRLHPRLQKLHREGGVLKGKVSLEFGRGLAGLVGRRLAKKLGLPEVGEHQLSIHISHSNGELQWQRQFNSEQTLRSIFIPCGTKESGYWLEKTGVLELRLTVDIVDGGWHWRTLKIKLYGIPILACLLPKTTAYKNIVGEEYLFSVEFSWPLLGSLVRYAGCLKAYKVDKN